jgi:hypothetical protein
MHGKCYNLSLSEIIKLGRKIADSKMMRPLVIIMILLAGQGTVLRSQNLHITYFTEARGLPSNQVRHVAMDDFGFYAE